VLFRPDLSVQSSLSTPDICLSWVDKLCLLEDTPESPETEVNGDSNVSGDEVVLGPVSMREYLPAVEENDHGEENKRAPCSVWLELALEDEVVTIDALSNHGLAEAEVGNTDGAPCEQLRNGGQVDEPVEDEVGAARDGEEGEEGDGCRDGNAPVWNTVPAALEEDLGCLVELGNAEEVTGASVEEGIGGGGGGGEDDGVDN